MRKQILEETQGSGKIYKFVERNQLGEKIVVQIRKATTDVGVGRENHPRYWLSVTTLVIDRKGDVREKYNPQIKVVNNKRTVDKKWILEPSMENTQSLLEQVERLAFGGQ